MATTTTLTVNEVGSSQTLVSRRQNKSCDQCRSGKRRCDIQIGFRDGVFSSTICSNCQKWKKHCSTKWAESRHTSSEPISKRRCLQDKSCVHLRRATAVISKPQTCTASSESGIHWHDVSRMQTTLSEESASPEIRQWQIHNYDGDIAAGPPPGFPSQVLHQIRDYSNPQDGTLFRGDSPPFTRTFSDDSVFRQIPWEDSLLVTDDAHRQEQVNEDGPWTPLTAAGYRPRPAASDPALDPLPDIHAKAWLKTSLLKVYHDSMEGALSCWLVARNCPYNVNESDQMNCSTGLWSNRIAKQVCALDHDSFEAGHLSKDHRAQGSRVLNLAIMAFAAQWAQAGPRSTTRLPGDPHPLQYTENDPFGANLQESLWYEASQALSAANGNSSFKVIFAGIIFSLAQRPLGKKQILEYQQQPSFSALQNIVDQDDSSVYLDVALRKLHSLQRKYDDTGSLLPQGRPAGNDETFRLLFWLAVMFDTLSATMHRKAFIVNDRDSSIDRSQQQDPDEPIVCGSGSSIDLDGLTITPPANPAPAADTIWGDLFLQDKLHNGLARKQSVRWPCAFEDAASCLVDAAPVKVLIFRRVGHLQDLYYQKASPNTIEAAINAVFEVYNHWNTHYGLFISDCITQHESLPPQIQSWYILLAGHWHLAVLLFADLLDKLDTANLAHPYQKSNRILTATSETLRHASVETVSNLGRASRYTSNADLSFTQSRDFHHAVNKAALLTEPWTVVLVRCFTKAAEILIRDINLQRELELVMDVQETMREARQRLRYCLEALWLLGKKSDVAFCAAQVLQSLSA